MSNEPSISFQDSAYTVKVYRDDREVSYTFGEHHLEVCACLPEDLPSRERLLIKGPAADDGKLYYLIAQRDDVGMPSFVWIRDLNEAILLRKKLRESESCQVCKKDFCWGH